MPPPRPLTPAPHAGVQGGAADAGSSAPDAADALALRSHLAELGGFLERAPSLPPSSPHSLGGGGGGGSLHRSARLTAGRVVINSMRATPGAADGSGGGVAGDRGDNEAARRSAAAAAAVAAGLGFENWDYLEGMGAGQPQLPQQQERRRDDGWVV